VGGTEVGEGRKGIDTDSSGPKKEGEHLTLHNMSGRGGEKRKKT